MIYISLGSNLGNRLQNLRNALKEMTQHGLHILKVSPVYETPALLPSSSPSEWNKDFLNAVCEIKAPGFSPKSLLKTLKSIEKALGRKASPQWAPRIIDLDILLFKDQMVDTSHLKIPHPGLKNRNFVLAPLKDINPLLKIPFSPADTKKKKSNPNQNDSAKHIKKYPETALSLFRKSCQTEVGRTITPLPIFMQIVNVTPDSFSDGGQITLKKFKSLLRQTSQKPIAFLDLGAESTRPLAQPLSPQEEWQRLKPYIELFNNFYGENLFRPRLSIDTRHAKTAQKALSLGADVINDVSGLSLDMLTVLKTTQADYVLTHSLTVPASREHTLPQEKDPVEEIKKWLTQKINILEQNNISLKRVIFDPGIGFGKTTDQSLKILNRIREFHVLPLRIMVGHSRKSFMQGFAPLKAEKRDLESIGVSLKLAQGGVDILRVHRADLHARALRGFML